MALKISSESTDYDQVDDGDSIAITWKDQVLNLCCCDCGLVHSIDIEVVDDAVTMMFLRNEEETEKARKRKRVTIKEVVRARDGG
jgi:hypothetical protein